eukprot:CAMPEP_0205921018 /NCGR_PEP_ID=MMETSP1325-20131115/12147_1 /ASSEMBLY_ACC=CAM_ASM_000708 /TAXON_ID=236786 /ORGANISM="Florenciella sp., Strain RCC1007" /LENGTH=55 /DNA_ID=CAMNT_0053288781 /DNA_START=77 /DNA_END=240 /DNA_ORIENTATION=+
MPGSLGESPTAAVGVWCELAPASLSSSASTHHDGSSLSLSPPLPAPNSRIAPPMA